VNQPRIILIGAGGHSHACIDAIEQQGLYRIAGLVCADGEPQTALLGYPVIGNDADLPDLARGCGLALIAVGHIHSGALRMRLYQQANFLGFGLPAIVASSAYVSRHAHIGAGTLVMHGAIINAGARVGANCIVNSRALIEHDASVADHCHISTGAILNGDVHVGAGSFIGSGSVIKQGISIGQGCTVGMGLAVRHHQPDHAHYLGSTDRP
jgi:sugar O-acyltransferase (sialic acid O-acetyltransferase NeuD family)